MTKRILVIDDDEDILEAVTYLLMEEGYTVMASKRGDYAESLFQNSMLLPDLIILDVLLSGFDGRAIAQKLKKNEQTSTIPIIMVSAHPSIEKSVKEAGADCFISKPFDSTRLLNSIAQYVH